MLQEINVFFCTMCYIHITDRTLEREFLNIFAIIPLFYLGLQDVF